MRILFIFFLTLPLYSQNSKILCELDGTYSVTYKDIKKSYLSEGIELFKNLARQTQQSLFLLQRAKTNFAEEDWQKDKVYIVQYWEVDTIASEANDIYKTSQSRSPSQKRQRVPSSQVASQSPRKAHQRVLSSQVAASHCELPSTRSGSCWRQ